MEKSAADNKTEIWERDWEGKAEGDESVEWKEKDEGEQTAIVIDHQGNAQSDCECGW